MPTWLFKNALYSYQTVYTYRYSTLLLFAMETIVIIFY